MQPRVSSISLGVTDLDRSKWFCTDVLGWSPMRDADGIVMYTLNGMILSLFPQHELAEDAQVKNDGAGSRFTLAQCLRSTEEVDAFFAHLRQHGVAITKEPVKVFWGGSRLLRRSRWAPVGDRPQPVPGAGCGGQCGGDEDGVNPTGYIRPDPKPSIMGWKKYAFEFLSIFVAVIAAFALDKWNSDRKDAQAEEKILLEISHGLQKDLEDIRLNMAGHRDGMNACIYWRKVLNGEQAPADSLLQYTFSLTRDFIAIQNSSGYESLRSRGLELVQDDSLRSDIISLYEYDLKILAKLEEDYGEMQLHASYYPAFSALIAPHLQFSPGGVPTGLDLPLDLDPIGRDRFLLDLWKIQQNRAFTHHYYGAVEQRIREVDAHIGRVLAERS